MHLSDTTQTTCSQRHLSNCRTFNYSNSNRHSRLQKCKDAMTSLRKPLTYSSASTTCKRNSSVAREFTYSLTYLPLSKHEHARQRRGRENENLCVMFTGTSSKGPYPTAQEWHKASVSLIQSKEEVKI